MRVPTFANSNVHFLLLSKSSANAKSGGYVTLKLCGLPTTSLGENPANSMALASSVMP
jgi:hypothetical protein